MIKNLRFLCIGDVVGLTALDIFQKKISYLKNSLRADAIIVNGENAAKNGKGITPKIVDFFKEHGVSVISTGNHVWECKELYGLLNERNDIIRPANYPPGCPGKGFCFFNINGTMIAVVNLIGRVFMRDALDCPFRTIDSLLTFIRTKASVVIVDFHAEATSEKRAMGLFLDGKVSCMFGTHTHVPTADSMILPKGTGYVTDLGFCGSLYSVIGVQQEQVIERFLYHPYVGKFVVETRGPSVLSGICVEINPTTGKTVSIESVYVVDDNASAGLS